MSGPIIELICFLSPQVRKAAALGQAANDFVTWRVVANKPFEDIDNYGQLSQNLGVHALCELCDYSEGIVRDVIDTRRTPEELGFRPHMAVYLRQRRSTGSSRAVVEMTKRVAGLSLTRDEEDLIAKLRDSFRTLLPADQPCLLCNRVAEEGGEAGGGSRNGSPRSRSSATRRRSAPELDASQTMQTVRFRSTNEVGVQCGSAGRLGEPFAPVSFGTGARLRSGGDGPSSKGIAGSSSFPAPSSSSTAGARGAPSSSFASFDGEITELKEECERLSTERAQLVNLLREEQRKVAELQREKMDHRCEGNIKVQTYVQEIERLQSNLRDLMRGREEVYALLQQRKGNGSVLGDGAPRPYPPFATKLPLTGPMSVDPHSLLAKTANTISHKGAVLPEEKVVVSLADDPGARYADLIVAKRPSGGTQPHIATLQRSPFALTTSSEGPPGYLDQPPGQAMLKQFSSVGDSFYVKRLLGSQLIRGRNVFVLYSLDRTITDEIAVDDLQTVTAPAEGVLSLSSNENTWVLYMAPRERQRWVNWVYALNPWLSSQGNDPIPNNL